MDVVSRHRTHQPLSAAVRPWHSEGVRAVADGADQAGRATRVRDEFDSSS
jgi:phosphoribosylcarboxyaminoimidazole (NCAIR) mutase